MEYSEDDVIVTRLLTHEEDLCGLLEAIGKYLSSDVDDGSREELRSAAKLAVDRVELEIRKARNAARVAVEEAKEADKRRENALKMKAEEMEMLVRMKEEKRRAEVESEDRRACMAVADKVLGLRPRDETEREIQEVEASRAKAETEMRSIRSRRAGVVREMKLLLHCLKGVQEAFAEQEHDDEEGAVIEESTLKRVHAGKESSASGDKGIGPRLQGTGKSKAQAEPLTKPVAPVGRENDEHGGGKSAEDTPNGATEDATSIKGDSDSSGAVVGVQHDDIKGPAKGTETMDIDSAPS